MMSNNNKKRGFTLIELLAVIVILAVIALIAVPQILNILNRARKSAAEDTTSGIAKSAENYVTSFMLKNNGGFPDADIAFKCSDDGCILKNNLDDSYNTDNLTTLDFKGTKPTSGSITISENGKKVTAYGLIINNFVCNYGDGISSCIGIDDIGPTQENPPEKQHQGVLKIVYLDPTDLTNKCTSTNVNSNTGTKTGCMKWYAYAEDDNQNTYTMILDHNTTAMVAWNSDNTNSEMKEVKNQLESDVEGWNKSLSPRLISADEVAKIVDKHDFDVKKATYLDDWFYFHDLTNNDLTGRGNVCKDLPNGCKYAWLYDRTKKICETYGCLNNSNIDFDGYWTSSPCTGTSASVWYVAYFGRLTAMSANKFVYGVRPVITISKSNIN